MWLVLYVTYIDLTAQVHLTHWSAFLFLDIKALKLRIIVTILFTNQPEIILLIALSTKSCLHLSSKGNRTVVFTIKLLAFL